MALLRSCGSKHTRSLPRAFSEATNGLTHLVCVVTLAVSMRTSSFFRRSRIATGTFLGGCTTGTAFGLRWILHSSGISPKP